VKRKLLPLLLCVAVLVTLQTEATAKKKKPKAPTQPDFSRDCIYVSDIFSHALSIFSGVAAPEPGIEPKVYNSCNVPVSAFLTFGYFDRQGVQFGNGIQSMIVAPGATYSFYHNAEVYGLDRGRLKIVKIISAAAYPQ